MELSVTCDCGAKIPVSPAACGSALLCRCGQQVQVPKLSELRSCAGLEAYQRTTAEQVQSLWKAGSLPLEEHCVQCGRPTDYILAASVECERPATGGSRLSRWLSLLLIDPWLGLKAAAEHYEKAVAHGNDIVVNTPLRICLGCLERIQGERRELIHLLQKTELYRQLLSEYPKASIHFEFPKT